MSDETRPYRFVGTYAILNDGVTIEFKKFGQQSDLSDDQVRFALDRRIPLLPDDIFQDLGLPKDVQPNQHDFDKAVNASEQFRKQRLTPAVPKEPVDAN